MVSSSRAEDGGQAHQRDLPVEAAAKAQPVGDVHPWQVRREQADQGLAKHERDFGLERSHAVEIADELDGVAVTLFPVDQKLLAADVLALPWRGNLGQFTVRELVGLETSLVLLPTVLKVAGLEKSESIVTAHLGVVGIIFQRLLVQRYGLFMPPQPAEGSRAVPVHLGSRGAEVLCLFDLLESLLHAAELAQHHRTGLVGSVRPAGQPYGFVSGGKGFLELSQLFERGAPAHMQVVVFGVMAEEVRNDREFLREPFEVAQGGSLQEHAAGIARTLLEHRSDDSQGLGGPMQCQESLCPGKQGLPIAEPLRDRAIEVVQGVDRPASLQVLIAAIEIGLRET